MHTTRAVSTGSWRIWLANAHRLQNWVLHRVIRTRCTVYGIVAIANVEGVLRTIRNVDVTCALGLKSLR